MSEYDTTTDRENLARDGEDDIMVGGGADKEGQKLIIFLVGRKDVGFRGMPQIYRQVSVQVEKQLARNTQQI